MGHSAFVLFDSGASHSFISSAFVESAMLESAPLGFEMRVSTPVGKFIIADSMISTDDLCFMGCCLHATLIIMPMSDFDVILGMDWLSANRATIDCTARVVDFMSPCGTSVRFRGSSSRSVPALISMLEASMLLSDGALGYIASVVDTLYQRLV